MVGKSIRKVRRKSRSLKRRSRRKSRSLKRRVRRKSRSPKKLKIPKYSMNIINIDYDKIFIHLKTRNPNKFDGSKEEEDKLLTDAATNISKNELFKETIFEHPKIKGSWLQMLKKLPDKKNLEELVHLRKLFTDALLDVLCKKTEGCDYLITGSKTLTSDIDVTLTVTKDSTKFTIYTNLEKILNTFHDLFKNKNSTNLLDLNFYAHTYFFPKNRNNLFTLNETKERETGVEEFYLELNDNQEKLYTFQLAFALLKIITYDRLKSIVDEDSLTQITELCSDSITKFEYKSKELGDQIEGSTLIKNDGGLFKYVTEMREKDTEKLDKYLDQLKYIDSLIQNFNSKGEDEFFKYMLICEISHASIYADEAYFCYGAFMDIVYNNQLKNKVKLSKNCYVHSILDNFGFLLHVFDTCSSDTRKFIIKGSKYIERIYRAYMLKAEISTLKKSSKKVAKDILNVFETYSEIRRITKEKTISDEDNKKLEIAITCIILETKISEELIKKIYNDIIGFVIDDDVTPVATSKRGTPVVGTPVVGTPGGGTPGLGTPARRKDKK